MCYSTSCSALAEVYWWNHIALYHVVPYIAACVDVSRTVFRDHSVFSSWGKLPK